MLDAIEQRRSVLLDSDKEIAFMDYGAGPSDAQRTQEQMEQGVPSRLGVNVMARASKPPFWASILFKIVRGLAPKSCLELGTCVGISGSYQAQALSLNGEGALFTLEGSPDVAATAKETFECLGIDNVSVVTGPFHKTLQGVMERAQPIDYFFNDGHHDHDA